ncbi:MAG: imidazole glycerol phosphate synthase subunit HisH, partial [Phycisphaerae bacterium]
MIVIIDYGMGNLRSVQKGFERVGAQAQIVQKPEPIHQADKLVLPGVGGFSQAMAHLCRQGLVEPLRQFIASGRPFLGICLGLQLLFERSYEEGEHTGLGVLRGQVVRFESVRDAAGQALKVPHMGWNRLEWDRPCPLLDGLRPGTYF